MEQVAEKIRKKDAKKKRLETLYEKLDLYIESEITKVKSRKEKIYKKCYKNNHICHYIFHNSLIFIYNCFIQQISKRFKCRTIKRLSNC